MSWDVWILRVPRDLERLHDLPSDHQFPPFGRGQVVHAARRTLGAVRPYGWSDTAQAFTSGPIDAASFIRIDGPHVFGELGLPDDSEDSRARGMLTLNVRGGTDELVASILDFASDLEARAFDLQTGDWLAVEDGATSFALWAGYRQRTIESGADED